MHHFKIGWNKAFDWLIDLFGSTMSIKYTDKTESYYHRI